MAVEERQSKRTVTSRSLLYSTLATVLLIGSTSFGESLFDHLRRLWLLAGQTRQGIWDALLDRVGESQATLWMYGKLLKYSCTSSPVMNENSTGLNSINAQLGANSSSNSAIIATASWRTLNVQKLHPYPSFQIPEIN